VEARLAHPEPLDRAKDTWRPLLCGLALCLMAASFGCRAQPPLEDEDDAADAEVAQGSAVDADSATAADTAVVDSTDGPDLPPLQGTCTPGETRCGGLELDTCGPAGTGWIRGPCFPGLACDAGACVAYANNLIIIFDTSGSMAANVPGVDCKQGGFPDCKPTEGCSRMDVSKVVFAKALGELKPLQVSLALFRFPSQLFDIVTTDCQIGFQVGTGALAGDNGSQSVMAATKWYWTSLAQVLAVSFPTDAVQASTRPAEMLRWMDGVEVIAPSGQICSSNGAGCSADASCAGGSCCAAKCYQHSDPELRATGGTPIGKTLFYVGEYLKNRVFVDGAACSTDGDCGTPYHRCAAGSCTDALRACRETTIVMFTDGGQDSDPNDFFSPLPMAKRLAYGLGCATNGDCVGGATCVGGSCTPAGGTGSRCLATGLPCLSGAPVGDPLHCPALAGVGVLCAPDPALAQTAIAKLAPDNVLRAQDGVPVGVRLQVVDVSGSATIEQSFALASAGAGRVLTADTADTASLLSALQLAFDLKNKKVCGNVN
jgi:hypothetical protein